MPSFTMRALPGLPGEVLCRPFEAFGGGGADLASSPIPIPVHRSGREHRNTRTFRRAKGFVCEIAHRHPRGDRFPDQPAAPKPLRRGGNGRSARARKQKTVPRRTVSPFAPSGGRNELRILGGGARLSTRGGDVPRRERLAR